MIKYQLITKIISVKKLFLITRSAHYHLCRFFHSETIIHAKIFSKFVLASHIIGMDEV